MTMPLEGIRVADWTIYQQGPVASVMLGDMGAEVIKIEDRVKGDPGRGILKWQSMIMGSGLNVNWYHELNNRNKKSLTINLKKEKSKEIIRRLIEKSDVFVTNFRRPVVNKLSMDYKTLSQYNPKLVYAAATGYGPKGPDKDKGALDPVIMARSGLMDAITPSGMTPYWSTTGIADQIGAIMLAYATLLGLIARDRFGIGQEVSASHLSSCMWLQYQSIGALLLQGQEFSKHERKKQGNPLYNVYRCQDDKWMFIALHQADRFWSNFCKALNITEIETDSRFADSNNRAINCIELIKILDNVFATKSRNEWLEILAKFPDFIFDKVNSISDLRDDPQVMANDYITGFNHPVLGKTQVLGIPIILEKTPGSLRVPAPEFGQHTEEVLIDVCGYNWNEINDMKEQEVI